MSGHNHFSSCTCGWCLKLGGRRGSGVLHSGGGSALAFRTYESFTIPNASCPVCGASVFFYQSPSGGRVFFDDLGPPWPKHPCTDLASTIPKRAPVPKARKGKPQWVDDGWTPVVLQNSHMVGQWHVVPVHVLASGSHAEVLSAVPLRLPLQCCASMRAFDGGGRGELSFVDLDRPSDERRLLIFERKRFSGVSPYAASRPRGAGTAT